MEDGSDDILIAVNAPRLNTELIQELHDIEKTTQAKLKYALGTDWHHMFIMDWAKEFGLTALFSSPRGWRFHEKKSFNN